MPSGLPPLPGKKAVAVSATVVLAQYQERLRDHICTCKLGDLDDAALEAAVRTCLDSDEMVRAATRRATKASVAAGRVAYDPRRAALCLREWAAMCAGTNSRTGDTCKGVFRGLVPLGGACLGIHDCAQGHCHGGDLEHKMGVCTAYAVAGKVCKTLVDCLHTRGTQGPMSCIRGRCAPTPTTVGAKCSLVCSASLVCDPKTKTCQKKLSRGSPCVERGWATDCAKGQACLRTALGLRCTPKRGERESCVRWKGAGDNTEEACQSGFLCLATPKGDQCMPIVRPGGVCRHPGQCRTRAIGGAFCFGYRPGHPGRCERLPVGGESCAVREKGARRCGWPYVCHLSRQVYVTKLVNKNPCSAGYCGGSYRRLTCVRGVCRKRLARGAACTAFDPERRDRSPRCLVGLSCVKGVCTPD